MPPNEREGALHYETREDIYDEKEVPKDCRFSAHCHHYRRFRRGLRQQFKKCCCRNNCCLQQLRHDSPYGQFWQRNDRGWLLRRSRDEKLCSSRDCRRGRSCTSPCLCSHHGRHHNRKWRPIRHLTGDTVHSGRCPLFPG